VIGSGGGEVTLGHARLIVPSGALSQDVTISITATGEDAPANFIAFSKVYRFEPSGTRFSKPVQIYLPFTGDASLATIYFSRADASGYDALATQVMGSVAGAEVNHLSLAFVASLPAVWDQAQWNSGVWQ
jgi:hypothetical protein